MVVDVTVELKVTSVLGIELAGVAVITTLVLDASTVCGKICEALLVLKFESVEVKIAVMLWVPKTVNVWGGHAGTTPAATVTVQITVDGVVKAS